MLFSVFQLNMFIEVFCAAFSLVGLLSVALFAQPARQSASWYRRSVTLMFIFNTVFSLADAAANISRGQLSGLGWYGTHVGNALTYVAIFLLSGAFTSYIITRLGAERSLGWWGSSVWVLSAVGVALTLSGLFYVIDPMTNIYHRTQYFWISQALGVFIETGNLIILIRRRRAIPTQTFISAILYIVLPTAALIAQMFLYGIALAQIATTVSLMIMFIDLQMFLAQDMARQQEALAQQERQLSDSRIQIMVSQIQPHFLYNTLDAIYYLCGKDQTRAREAISRFSDYLRTNLRSLSTTTPVAFTTELEHVKNYLELEQMSSDDTINFELDIQATNFMLPSLSLQPLVENAVKHGVTKQLNGGTITLRTREQPSCFEVIVEDDGVGFDPDAVFDDSRPHVGMQNVRQRLESMCGGSLVVTSEPGKGTRAVVTIPRRGVEDDRNRS